MSRLWWGDEDTPLKRSGVQRRSGGVHNVKKIQGERERMSQQIGLSQALGLYQAYLGQRIQGTPPALVNNKTLVIANPQTGQWIYLSLPELLSEVQRGTQIGVNESIKFASQQGYSVAG